MSTASAIRKPVVLVLASYYLPGYRSGGPVRSLSNLIDALGDEFEFHVVTRDRDLNEKVPYGESQAGHAVRIGKAEIVYYSSSLMVPWKIRKRLKALSPDLLYFNSFFDSLFTVFPLWLRRLRLIPGVPVLVAPRGEFSTGALGLKAFKKSAYLAMARPAGVLAGLRWHATGDSERSDISRATGTSALEISVAPNLGRRLPKNETEWQPRQSDALQVAFLSRISPMKNLIWAIEIVRASRVPVHFDIYGPIGDEEYWRQCRSVMEGSPAHVRITYRGAIENERVPEALATYDAFFLPSLGENYGHAIVEALTCGLPVLISDRTPWRGLREAGAGYALPLGDAEPFVAALEALWQRSADEVRTMRAAVLAYADRVHHDSDAVNRTRAMLLAAAGDKVTDGRSSPSPNQTL
ncbi:MAG: glycosyltransferase family 4 protein [Acidobacteriota bacterium]